jgi:DNA-binding transcriptional ArsR family regulator
MAKNGKTRLPVRRAAQFFGQLADETRLKILVHLAKLGKVNVTELSRVVGQSQPAVSHHLKLLRMSNVISYRRDGKCNYYSLSCPITKDLLKLVSTEAPAMN